MFFLVFFVTLYIPFGFFLYGFLYIQKKRVPFGSGLAVGLLLLMGSGSNICLYKGFLVFRSSYFIGRYFLCTSKGPYLCKPE